MDAIHSLIRVLTILLYAPIGVFAYKKLIPRLPASARRLLSILLLAQLLAVVMALETESRLGFERWLWHLNAEWNAPATLSTIQMSLVGGFALVAARLSVSRSIWQRQYLLAIGLVFLFLAYDEYSNFHEYLRNWERLYAALGLALVAATLAAAFAGPRSAWKWHICLLAGLAMSAAGALLIEQLKHEDICMSLGALGRGGCAWRYFLEEPLEFLGIWLALLGLLGQLSAVAPPPSRAVWALIYLWPALCVFLLAQTTAIITIPGQTGAQPATVEFASGARLHAFRIEKATGDIKLHLFMSPAGWDYEGLGYSIHLVDQVDGASVAGADKHADRQRDFFLAPGYQPVYRQWLHLVIPPEAPANRALWIVLTLWSQPGGEFRSQPVVTSDLRTLSDRQVILGEMLLPGEAAAPGATLAAFDNGFALEAAELPRRARPGDSLSLRFSWRSSADSSEDLVQFLHFVGEEDGAFWGFDQEPLGPRLPTRLWYAGLGDSEVWTVPLPADIAAGPYNVYTGLYRRSDLARIPARDRDGNLYRDASVPLGALIIER